MAPPPQQRKTKKGKSGNPAKRAQQEREAAQRGAERPGSAFGLGEPERAPDTGVDDLQVPAGLEKFLGR